MQGLAKDKAAAQNFVNNLEKLHGWIAEEKQYVHTTLLTNVIDLLQ